MANSQKQMSSTFTFQQEYQILLNEVPEALWNERQHLLSCSSYYDNIYKNAVERQHIAQIVKLDKHTLFPGSREDVELKLQDLPGYLKNLRTNKITSDDMLEHRIKQHFGFSLSKSKKYVEDYPVNIEDRLNKCGSNAFIVYFPMHKYYQSQYMPWGIHIFWKEFVAWVNYTFRLFAEEIPFYNWFNILLSAAYKTALFNYHVELFATKLEIVNRKPYYKPYITNVYELTYKTPKCLEDALKQASVLTSRMVARLSGTNTTNIKETYTKILEANLFPPGESDYKCEAFGGPAPSYSLLTSEIITSKIKPDPFFVTSLIDVREGYSRNDVDVPVYMLTEKVMLERIQ